MFTCMCSLISFLRAFCTCLTVLDWCHKLFRKFQKWCRTQHMRPRTYACQRGVRNLQVCMSPSHACHREAASEWGTPGVNVTQVWTVVWAIRQAVQVICILLGDCVSCLSSWKRNGSPCWNRFPWDSPFQQALGEQFWIELTTADGTSSSSPLEPRVDMGLTFGLLRAISTLVCSGCI